MIKFLLVLFLVLSVPQYGHAQTAANWPMLGADPQRTSRSTNEVPGQLNLLWGQPIKDYVASGVQPIVADNKVFIPTSRGLYAFHTENQTGNQYAWYFATELPLGNAPTYDAGFLYVGGLDRNLYKINAATGALVWKFIAGAGFVTNPVVVNGNVYLGNRDGYFYAVNASTGTQTWKLDTGNSPAPRAQINHSAAYSASNNRLFFGAMNGYAYAVNASTGALVWKKLTPSMGFTEYWPVVYEHVTPHKVIFTAVGYNRGGTDNLTGDPKLSEQRDYLDLLTPPTISYPGCPSYPNNKQLAGTVSCPVNQTPTVDVSTNPLSSGNTVINYLEQHFHSRSTYIFDQGTGEEAFFNLDGTAGDAVPFLRTTPDHQTSYPPLITPDGLIWGRNPIMAGGTFSGSVAMGWVYGTSTFKLGVSTQPGLSEAWEMDEWFGFTGGGNYLYWGRATDGNVGGANLSLPNTSFPGSTANRQWKYVSHFDNFNLINANKEASKFIAEPGKLVPNSMLQYAADHVTGPVPYGNKVFVMLSNTLFAFSPSGTGYQTSNVKSSTPIPPSTNATQIANTLSASEMQIRLGEEINKIIPAGHLKPGFARTGLSDGHVSPGGDYEFNNLFDYWANPAETILILTNALPHIAEPLKSQLKTYIKSEYQTYFPAAPNPLITHVGWVDGVFRQSFDFPAGIKNAQLPKQSTNFPPHNIYAVWKYVEADLCELPNCTPLGEFNKIKSKLSTTVPDSATDSYLNDHPHLLNSYIAGYEGYIKLAGFAGQSISSGYAIELTRLKNLKKNELKLFPVDNFGNLPKYYHVYNTFSNFMYLTSELGDFLHDSDKYTPVIKPAIELNTDKAPYPSESNNNNSAGPRGPYYMLAHNDTVNGENGVMPYHQTWSLFQAKALILQESQAELSKYIDSPTMQVGDLYYIHNLVAALDAGSNPPPPPLPSPSVQPSAQPSPSEPPSGDVNGDGTVNFQDVELVIINFGLSGDAIPPGKFTPTDVNDDGLVNIFDYNYVIADFDTPPSSPQPSSSPGSGMVPLIDMTSGNYFGKDGGLYGGYTNNPPTSHDLKLDEAVGNLTPLGSNGQPLASGKIVVLTIGMSNTNGASEAFIPLAGGDSDKASDVVIVNGAKDGSTAIKWSEWTNPAYYADTWGNAQTKLTASGVTPAQVQVIWMKLANIAPSSGSGTGSDGFQYVNELTEDLRQIIGKTNDTDQFPNAKLIFMTNRVYGGYATTTLNPEPYAYENAFAVRNVLLEQVQGTNPAVSYTAVPVLSWGPYFWANGATPNSEGLFWLQSDFSEDGTHPNATGYTKEACKLLKFFKTSPYGYPWFTQNGTASSTLPAACGGSPGGGSLNSATGDGYWDNNSSPYDPQALPSDTIAKAKIDEAVAEVRSRFTGTPKLLMVGTNLPHQSGYMTYLFNALMKPVSEGGFGTSVPIIGAGSGNSNRNTFTLDTFVEHDDRSVAVMALGGNAIEKVVVKQKLEGNPSTFDYYQTGQELALALEPELNSAKTNLIHLFGPAHDPNQTLVMNGIKDVLKDGSGNFPAHIKIIGGGAYVPPSGSSVVFIPPAAQPSLSTQKLAAVLIQGSFDIALSGKGTTGGSDKNTTDEVVSAINSIKAELGGSPDVLFFVPNSMVLGEYELLRQAVVGSLGSGTTLFGHEASTEYGHLTTGGQPQAVTGHFFFAGIKGN